MFQLLEHKTAAVLRCLSNLSRLSSAGSGADATRGPSLPHPCSAALQEPLPSPLGPWGRAAQPLLLPGHFCQQRLSASLAEQQPDMKLGLWLSLEAARLLFVMWL